MDQRTTNAAEVALAAGQPQRTALECGDERVSYGELRERVARAAGGWRLAGLQPGARLVVFAPDSIEWVVAYLGAIHAGGVPIGVNPRLSMAELAPIAAESGITHVWCEAEQADPLAGLAAKLDPRPAVIHALPASDPIAAHPWSPDDPALWIGTSGTTGVPKGVVHKQSVTAPCDRFAREILGAGADDRFYASSKLFFAYALANSLFAGLRLGATVILDREWPTPERVAEMAERHRPSILFSVPTLYHKMLQAGLGAQLGQRGIRHFVSAGEALPGVVRSGWREATGKQIVSGYGTSETLCLMLYCDDDSGLARPTPLTRVRFEEGADPAAPQRIWVSHPAVAAGYWQRPEAQEDGFRDGWYRPGDTFIRHDGGRLEFAGRNDDMLKIAGQWVSTLWVEQALGQACGDAVLQLASVGVSTADGLTALAVLAVALPGREEQARQRIAAGIAALPGHRRPRWVHWVDQLPLTATGKLQRSRLKALHEQAVRTDRP